MRIRSAFVIIRLDILHLLALRRANDSPTIREKPKARQFYCYEKMKKPDESFCAMNIVRLFLFHFQQQFYITLNGSECQPTSSEFQVARPITPSSDRPWSR
uniref:Uncharacterized protein n=1 Tax=Siphoviridae sp. ctoMB99 TaxID=2826459 RepID=A0A8S5MZV2_9CAUD|nr:MAG TPA: hypothetical protein [Siphoviridae sp. ctoMB99]